MSGSIPNVTGKLTVATNTYTSGVFRQPAEFVFFHIVYTSTATAGNRQIRVEMLDSANDVIWDARGGAVQAASLVRDYAMMPGTYRETAFIDGQIHVPFPQGMELPENYRFKVYDANGVDAGDSMFLTWQYELR